MQSGCPPQQDYECNLATTQQFSLFLQNFFSLALPRKEAGHVTIGATTYTWVICLLLCNKINESITCIHIMIKKHKMRGKVQKKKTIIKILN